MAERSSGMCVLTFHGIVGECQRDHDVTWHSFRRLLDAIAATGDAIESRLSSTAALQARSVALTFDDGMESHERVAEELARRGISAVFFVSAGKVGQAGRLGARALHTLCSLGHAIGSHGLTHAPLENDMPYASVRRELGDSKALLEDYTGTRIVYFAPSGGSGSDVVKASAETFGYEASRSMKWGIYGSLRDRWDIPCVPVTEFTLARGWVMHALMAHRIPWVMRSVSVLKSLVPPWVRGSLRERLHQARRPVSWNA